MRPLKRSSRASASSRIAEQDADPQPGPRDELRQLSGERRRALFLLVVEEVLLRLVEHEEQVAVEPARPLVERVGRRGGTLARGEIGPEHVDELALDASSSAAIGSCVQPPNTTTTNSGCPRVSRFRFAIARRWCATPARSTLLLPTPLAP